MQTWLQIFLIIFITLAIISGLVFAGYKIYKNLTKSGTCNFVSFSSNGTNKYANDSYTQAGYISCGGGGSLWKAEKITILNQGPGTFYIGPIPGQDSPQELDPENSITIDVTRTYPNVYYQSGSQNSTPNFTINVVS